MLAHHKPKPMHIVVFNRSTSTHLDQNTLLRICAAIQHQVTNDMAPAWNQLPAAVDLADTMHAIPADAVPIVILDDADQAGALGYHDVTPDGKPYGKVFLNPILKNGGTLTFSANSLSVALSHEILETCGDPYADFWADAAYAEYALELCDAVEGDSYTVDNIAVSNFVLPRFFRAGPGPYDFMRKLTAPFTMTDGGYQIQKKGGQVTQVWAMGFPDWKKAGKQFPAARTYRRSSK